MIQAPPSVIAGGGVCCFRQQHPLWHRRDEYGSRPTLKPVGGRYRAFWRARVFSPSITPSAFLDALMAAMTCGTIFDRASYSYTSKAIGSLSRFIQSFQSQSPPPVPQLVGEFLFRLGAKTTPNPPP